MTIINQHLIIMTIINYSLTYDYLLLLTVIVVDWWIRLSVAVITGPPDVLGRSPGCHWPNVGCTQCHTVAIGKREKLHPGAQEVNDWATQQIDYGKRKRRGHSKRWTNEARRRNASSFGQLFDPTQLKYLRPSRKSTTESPLKSRGNL